MHGGFDLDAGVVVAARDRAQLERVCRYALPPQRARNRALGAPALRPPIAHDRIGLTSEGDVLLELRHRWRDGTTHLRFQPLELLERLASLTPRPRNNLVLYYGVLAAHAAWRPRLPAPEQSGRLAAPSGTVAARDAADDDTTELAPARSPAVDPVGRPGSNRSWAQFMQRTFGFDALQCPRCGGRLRLLAVIGQGAIACRILSHLGLPTEVPPARPPPLARGTRYVQFDLDTP